MATDHMDRETLDGYVQSMSKSGNFTGAAMLIKDWVTLEEYNTKETVNV